MREVDEALARAFAQRAASEHPSVPPPPHVAAAQPRQADPRIRGADRTPTSITWPRSVLNLEREYGDRFSSLADVLVAARDGRQVRTVLFTSCHRAEGRTTLVLTLARALARRPGRTLIVDADLNGPMIARALELHPTIDLEDVVEEGGALSDALIEAPDDHLTFFPLRAPAAHPRELLTGSSWSSIAMRLRRDFELVLVDGGPIFNGLGVEPAPRGMDAAVLVRNPDVTGEKVVARACDVLRSAGIALLGVAETFVK